MNPFEYPYHRERALKAAVMQRQGRIPVESNRPEDGGLPLPCMNDLQGLEAARHPYSYQCEWGRFKFDYDARLHEFIPHNGKLPPDWDVFDLSVPLRPVTAKVDTARRVITIQAAELNITLLDVAPDQSGYTLIAQINAALAAAHQPLVAWRVEWLDGTSNQLWGGESPPIVRNQQTYAHVTGFAYDADRSLIYLGMVGHKTCLESIRATLQANQRQRKYLSLGSRTISPNGHYVQTWQHLPDYNSHHATITCTTALPGKWQPGEMVSCILVFDGNLEDGVTPEVYAREQLVLRLSEALTIPVLDEWAGVLWEAAREADLITELETGGDCLAGYRVLLTEQSWADLVQYLLKEHRIVIPNTI